MAIPNLAPVDPWPTRKQPQERFDTAVKTAMDQMSVMVGELNSSFIPAANETAEAINTLNPDLPAIRDAPNQAAAAAASAEAAAGSAGAAAESVSAAAQEVEKAKAEVVNAQAEVERAKAEADRAEAIAGVGPAMVGKLGLTKPDGETTKTDEFGTMSVPTFEGSAAGLVPAATPSDAKKVLLGNGTWGSAEDDAAAMTISEDLHLTADSPRTLVLTASASALSVCLPDTATLPEGTTFHIIVRPLEDIQLCDFSGQSIKAYPVLSANAAIRVQLVDSLTGLWALSEYKSGSTSDAQGKLGLNIGDLTVFSSGAISGISIATLSETKAIVCYSDGANSFYPTAVVLSISGIMVTVGDATVLNSEHEARYLLADTLSENKVLACYGDRSNINVRILTISGISIVLGDVFTFYGSHMGIMVKVLSENKAIVGYYYNSSDMSRLYAKVITIDGDNIKFGSDYDIDHNSNSMYYNIGKIFSLSKDKVVLFCNEGNSRLGYILVISETNITKATENYISSNLELNSIIQLSPGKYVATNTGSNGPLVILIDISNTTINCSEPIQIDNYSANSRYLIALSLTKFLVFYRDSSNKFNTYKVRLCEVSGTSIAIRGTIYSDLVEIPSYISLLSPELPTILGLRSGTPSTTGIMYFA